MSRTYRKSSVSDEMTKVQYINRHKKYQKTWHYEWVFTNEGKAAYEKALEEFHKKNPFHKFLVKQYGYSYAEHGMPKKWEYEKRVVVHDEVDWESVEKNLSDEYDLLKRDGRCKESGRNKAFKRLSKKAIRAKNRADIFKEIYEDEGCKVPYAGDYIGKKFVWSIW